jgi:hypothetical protein
MQIGAGSCGTAHSQLGAYLNFSILGICDAIELARIWARTR